MKDTASKHSPEGDLESLPRRATWLLSGATLTGVWLETTVFSLAAMAIARYFSPDDPLFVNSQFPWPWFAPVLLALRYGVLPGIGSSALLLLGWYVLRPDPEMANIPTLYFLGGLLMVMISAEYSSLWRTRLRRMSEVNFYLEDRIERLTKRLYLLRLSHERLEQDMLSRPSTLRDAVSALRRRVAVSAGAAATKKLPGSQELLDFLSQYCQLEVAAIYVSDAGDGSANADSGDKPAGYHLVAEIGSPPPLQPDDPLLVFARQRRQLAHIQVEELDKAHPTEHLMVAPIDTGRGQHLGMLVVTRMPFFAMNEEMLQMVAVLLSAYADGVTSAAEVIPLISSLPGLPVVFAEEYVKLLHLQKRFNINSHIVILVCFGHPERLDIFAQIKRERRQPDVVWAIEGLVECSIIITLMPLGGAAAVDGYLIRMENSLRETHGEDFKALGVYPHVIPLTHEDPLEAIKRILFGREVFRA